MPKVKFSDGIKKLWQKAVQISNERNILSDKCETYMESGMQKYLNGDIEGADSDFHQSLKFNPEMYHAVDFLGLLEMNLRKDYPKAEKLFLKALKSKCSGRIDV